MSAPRRLRDLDDDLGAAFRSADRDEPRPEAKAALMAALGIGAATLATGSAAAAAAGSGAATTAAAGGSTAAVAKGAGMAAVVKWVIASAVVVSGAAATVRVVSPPGPARPTAPAYVVPPVETARRVASSTATNAAPTTLAPTLTSPDELPDVVPERSAHSAAQPPTHVAARTPPTRVSDEIPNRVAVVEGATSASPPSAEPAARGASSGRADDDGPRRPTVGEEIAQLDVARSLLARGRGADALEAVRAYRRTFPAGVLAEEASVLEIESLATAGQSERARALGSVFVASHPRSPLVPRVVRATSLEGRDPPP